MNVLRGFKAKGRGYTPILWLSVLICILLMLSSCGSREISGGETREELSLNISPETDEEESYAVSPTEAETSDTPGIIYQYDYLEVGVSPPSGDETFAGRPYVIPAEDEDLSILNTSPDTHTVYSSSDHVTWSECLIRGDKITLKAFSDGSSAPGRGDGYYYLIELKPYEDNISAHAMTASVPKAEEIEFTLDLVREAGDDRLYNKFVIATWEDDHYVAVSDYVYITNPEAAARVVKEYKEPLSKKGLLIELSQISDAFSLGVCNVIINMPFDSVFGEGIDYEYDGEIYRFDKSVMEAYDNMISMFSGKSMNVHIILLNRFDPYTPELYDPSVSGTENGVKYYHFNAATEEGYKALRAVASFLASRYAGTDPDHGLVQNWIIGNEINDQSWNYIGPMDLSDYLREYERSFRVFYNAIKSEYASARIYFSLNNNWNYDADGLITYPASETLSMLAREISSHGNIDWGLAYHPYPIPSNEPEFWDDFDTGLVTWGFDSPVVNFANLSVLTDYMQQDYLLDPGGGVRHIVLSEQGFTSESATRGTVEELQAAAFAYAYYIVDSNNYIDSFILSRQIDAPSETALGLAFGLWTTDAAEDINIMPLKKKYIWNVFRNIDKQASTLEASEFAKDIIGINKWSDVISNFKWRRFEN